MKKEGKNLFNKFITTIRLGVIGGTGKPIYVIVGFQLTDRLNNRKIKNDSFFRLPDTFALTTICRTKLFYHL